MSVSIPHMNFVYSPNMIQKSISIAVLNGQNACCLIRGVLRKAESVTL